MTELTSSAVATEATVINTESIPLPSVDKTAELKTFFTLSFMHSQGEQFLQPLTMLWANRQGLLRGLKIPSEYPEYLEEVGRPKTHQSGGIRVGDSNRMNWSLMTAMANDLPIPLLKGTIYDTFARLRRMDSHALLFEVANEVLKRDLRYQDIPRPGRTNPIADNGANDPNASFIKRYAIDSQPAGHPIYQAMYEEIGKLIAMYQQTSFPIYRFIEKSHQRKLLSMVNTLAQKWETHHPGSKFFASRSSGGRGSEATILPR